MDKDTILKQKQQAWNVVQKWNGIFPAELLDLVRDAFNLSRYAADENNHNVPALQKAIDRLNQADGRKHELVVLTWAQARAVLNRLAAMGKIEEGYVRGYQNIGADDPDHFVRLCEEAGGFRKVCEELEGQNYELKENIKQLRRENLDLKAAVEPLAGLGQNLPDNPETACKYFDVVLSGATLLRAARATALDAQEANG